jgi:hypothetical protein
MAACGHSKRRSNLNPAPKFTLLDALWAVFNIDIEYAFEQARPTHARRGAMRVSVIGCVIGCMLCWTRNDRSAQLGVGCEQAVETNQMQPQTRHRSKCSRPIQFSA